LIPQVTLEDSFIDDADDLFAWMLAHTTWDTSMKARLTASFGKPYDYVGISYPEAPMPPRLQQICDKLHERLGFKPNNCLVNYYPDGNSKMGFHSDSISELEGDTGVAVITLGAARPLRFRLLGDNSVRHEIVQQPGSLLYLPQEVHATWAHAIPRRKHADPRISLTFRQLK
jgi:alkylated DNA repair dioxygenase AlkB